MVIVQAGDWQALQLGGTACFLLPMETCAVSSVTKKASSQGGRKHIISFEGAYQFVVWYKTVSSQNIHTSNVDSKVYIKEYICVYKYIDTCMNMNK